MNKQQIEENEVQRMRRYMLTDLKRELAESLAHEKTVEVAPPTGSWDRWPAGWMARRNYMTGLSHRRGDRRRLRCKIRRLKALIAENP